MRWSVYIVDYAVAKYRSLLSQANELSTPDVGQAPQSTNSLFQVQNPSEHHVVRQASLDKSIWDIIDQKD